MDNLDCGLSAFKLGFLLGFRSGGKKKQRLPLSSLDESDDFELQQTNISASTCDIACLRQTLGSLPEAIYIAYISNSHAKVKAAINKGTMSAHSWVDTGFDEEAVDVSIAFDGKIGSKKGRAEFITNNRPWVFWVTSSGELYGQVLGKSEKYLLSSENCTKVSAIRATYYQNPSDDFGFIVFFIDNGSIYYRQYINGIWYDAIHIDIESRSAVDLAAFRTFDYRVGLQIKTSTGSVIEIFSKYQGIGRNSAEHIEISNIEFNGQLLAVRYLNAKTAEHIEITNIFPSVELIKATPPVIISAQTIDDGTGNYGRFVQVVFDLPLVRSEVAAQPETFEIVDDRGIIFVAIGASANLDQKTVILEFDDFNAAHGQCSLVYTPGTIHGYSGTALLPINFPWTPEHLVPPAVPAPQVISIINVGYSDAGIRRVRYYNGSGQVLLHTEYVNYGADAAWGSGAEWSNVAEGEPVENILEDIVVDTDVYRASQIISYLPASTHIICESYSDNFDPSSLTWGSGTNPITFSATGASLQEDSAVLIPVRTNSIMAAVDLGAPDTPFTAYIVGKLVNPGSYSRIVMAFKNRSSGQGIGLYGSTISVSSWANDTSTGISSSANYFVAAIKWGSNSNCGGIVSPGSFISKPPSVSGQYVTLGRTDISPNGSNAEPCDILVRYFGVTLEAEDLNTIQSNIDNLLANFIP